MIVGAEVRQVEWLVPAGGAARSTFRRTSLLLALVDHRGTSVAFGEAAPLPGLSRDTIDDARRDLERWTRGDIPFDGSPAAAFAFETAMVGARAIDRGRALHAELRDDASDRLPLAAVVDTPEEAREAVARGITTLKIKVGPGIDHVFAIHRAVPTARLRLDANRAWSAAEAMQQLRSVAALPIDFVEEPCIASHATTWPVPLALDESLVMMTDDEIERALLTTVDALVLKPTLLGGLARCAALATKARRAGRRWTVSHCLEGPIGTAACAELALAIGGEAAGLAPHGALVAWDLTVSQLGCDHVHGSGRSGLGLELASLDELAGKVRAA